MRTFFRTAPVLALLLIPPAAPALAQGEPETGRVLAQQWCGGCHLVGKQAGVASDVAPTFSSIAAYPERDAAWLYRRVTVDPHPVMPNLDLTQQEARDIDAYLGTLAPERGAEPAAGAGGG